MWTHRPVWAEIDLKAIEHNIDEIRNLVGQEKKIMAIVKANAYGHGALEVSRTCLSKGVDSFAVATLEEAYQLRKSGIDCPILVLGWSLVEDYAQAIEHDIDLTIFDLEEAKLLNEKAKEMGRKARYHLKVDTGMGRIGLVARQENVSVAEKILSLPYLEIEGIYTHFSKADEKDKTYSYQQLKRFLNFIDQVEKVSGKIIPLKHAANSAAIIDMPESHLDMVRAGIILYGLKPSNEVNLTKINLEPAFNLKAKISRVEQFPPQTKISYGGKFITKEETIIVTLPIGYADGYTRRLSNKGEVLIRDVKCPIVGTICMDQLMVDATKVPQVKKGEEVILLGKGNNNYISADELAVKMETINYEVLTMLSERIPRKYHDPKGDW